MTDDFPLPQIHFFWICDNGVESELKVNGIDAQGSVQLSNHRKHMSDMKIKGGVFEHALRVVVRETEGEEQC